MPMPTSAMPYTPGPWFLINAVCVGGPGEPGFEEAGVGVAHCGMRARTLEEAAANARLISAAPDLHEALGDLLNCVDGGHDADWLSRVKCKARAALDKARGGDDGEIK